MLRASWLAGIVPVVPAPALVEVWRGASSARLAQALAECAVEPLDETGAKAAGELCGTAGTADVVDAVVVASAARRGEPVLTADVADLAKLAEHAGGVRVLDLSSIR